jgi:hypothetical protein
VSLCCISPTFTRELAAKFGRDRVEMEWDVDIYP